jgi:hypothetical protein
MEPKICPYLNLIDDPKTNKDFPYEGNACYRAKKPARVALPYQRHYCLSDEHINCPGYINGWVNGFPDSLKAHPAFFKSVLRNKWVWATLALLLLISVYIIFNQQINAMGSNWRNAVASRFTRPTATATEQFTPIPTSTPVPPTQTESLLVTTTSTSTITVTDTPSPTLTSTATETPTQITEASSYRVEVITHGLNIRSEPVYKVDRSNVVGTLSRGTVVEVFEEQNGWLRIERGWIFKMFTRVVD